MTPLLTTSQIREADAFTIANEPIASFDLMERASKAFANYFVGRFPDQAIAISVYCGTGNNGGDGLAISRLLLAEGYNNVNVKIARFSDNESDDFKINLQRLIKCSVQISEIAKGGELPPEDGDLIIDALLGTGLNKPLTGDFERLVKHINNLNKQVIAVDVPTGFFTEGEMLKEGNVLKADIVITFQQAKLNFLLPESGPYIKEWIAVNIGIDEKFTTSLNSPYRFIQEEDIKGFLKPRRRFSNKGSYGHALIIAGQPETMGAALLSSSACVYAGAGLTTACVPLEGLVSLNNYMPEIMAVVRNSKKAPEITWENYSTIGIGPGLGKDEESLALLLLVLKNYKKPLVIDADGLNLLAQHKELWSKIPPKSILTPHMKEFDRLFGNHANWWQRVQTGIQRAREHRLIILLKNDYTMVFTPDGKVFFNSTGNPAMATGGMGDVLTGIIAALMAQNYSPEDAAIAAVYIHGKAGDELALPNKLNVLAPSRLANQIPATMAKIIA